MKILILFILLSMPSFIQSKESEWHLQDTWRPILRSEVIIQTVGIDENRFYKYDLGLKYRPNSRYTYEVYYQNQLRLDGIGAASSIQIMERRNVFILIKFSY